MSSQVVVIVLGSRFRVVEMPRPKIYLLIYCRRLVLNYGIPGQSFIAGTSVDSVRSYCTI